MSNDLLSYKPQSPSEIKAARSPHELLNAIGSRGEAIAFVRLSEGYLFNLYFMGDKAETSDYLIELRDRNTPSFAFLQVKSTSVGQYTAGGQLQTKITTNELTLLKEKPLPTYYVGVDESAEMVYIAPVFEGCTQGYTSSIPNKYKLEHGQHDDNMKVLRALAKDIISYSKCIITRKKKYKTKLK